MTQQPNYVLEIDFDWTEHTYLIKDEDGTVVRRGITRAGEAVELRLALEREREAG